MERKLRPAGRMIVTKTLRCALAHQELRPLGFHLHKMLTRFTQV